MALGLAKWAGLDVAAGRLRRAACLFGAVAGWQAATGMRNLSRVGPGYEDDLAAARRGLAEPVFTRAWAEGRAMSLDQAITYAFADTPAAASPSHASVRCPGPMAKDGQD